MLDEKCHCPCWTATYVLYICSETVYHLLENPSAHLRALATSQTWLLAGEDEDEEESVSGGGKNT